MKHPNTKRIATFLTIIFLLLGLTACMPEISVSSSESGESSGEVQTSEPEKTSSSQSGGSVSFGFNMQFPGIFDREMEGAGAWVREFDYSGGELKANLILTNGSNELLELGLFVFCDGVPIEYTVLDSGKTGFFEILEVEKQKIFQISFKPDFDLNLGRIDFHLLPLPNEKSSVWKTEVTVAHAVLPEGYQAQGVYGDVTMDVQAAAMPDAMKNTKSTMTQMFVMDPGIEKEKIGTGGLEFTIAGKEEAWICACVPEAGKYRLTFLLDGEPLALEDGKTVFNCEIGEGEMFSATVPLKQIVPRGEHSLLAIATRVDGQSYQSNQSCDFLSSYRFKIIN